MSDSNKIDQNINNFNLTNKTNTKPVKPDFSKIFSKPI